jgi:hypothetical protein
MLVWVTMVSALGRVNGVWLSFPPSLRRLRGLRVVVIIVLCQSSTSVDRYLGVLVVFILALCA